jgi:sn-glycerol 3-phosphate transport system permease protein
MSLFKQITLESTPEEIKKQKLAEKRWHNVGSFGISLVNLFVGLIMFFPIFFVVTGGFKLDADFTALPPVLIPEPSRIQFAYYHIAFFEFPVQMFGDKSIFTKLFPSLISMTLPRIPRFMINSFVTSTVGTFVSMLLATLSAFAFALMSFKGKKVLFFIVLGTMMIPGDILLIANYITITKLNLIDTYLGIIIVSFVSAQNTFMLRQNFLTVSTSLKEASSIDGCGNFRFYTNICVPVSMPIIASLSMSSFVARWNAYLWPLLVTNNEYMRTVQVGVTQLTFEDTGSQAPLFASLAITLIPTLFIFMFFQRKLVRGITSGSTTG